MSEFKQSVPTSPNPQIVVQADGNLWLKGWDKSEVLASSSESEDLTVEQHNDEVIIYCREDCTLRIPLAANVQLKHVHGQATIKSLEGDLHVDEVDGNLTLRNVSTTTIQCVNGNLTVQDVDGDLTIHTVNGNVMVKDVHGDLLIEASICGNATLNDLDGNASAKVEGNLIVRLDPQPGSSHHFEAEGNLTCRLPTDASVTIEVRKAERIQANLPAIPQTSAPARAPYTVVLGDGDSTLTLSSAAIVLVTTEATDWKAGRVEADVDWTEDFEVAAETITEQVQRQIEKQMEMLERQLENQMENLTRIGQRSGLSPEQLERITERARAASERASARAKAKMQRVEEKLRRKLEHARLQAERAARDRRRRSVQFTWMAEPPPTETEREPVTDEERLMILKMVEDKKITLEEAEKLLKALEGEIT